MLGLGAGDDGEIILSSATVDRLESGIGFKTRTDTVGVKVREGWNKSGLDDFGGSFRRFFHSECILQHG